MEIPITIIFLGLLIIVAHLFNFLFKWIKLPNALLLMVIGILVGPLLGFVETSHFGKIGPLFTSLTLIIVLFKIVPTVGLEQSERNFFDEIAFVLQTYFFVYIGIAIKFSNIMNMIAGLIATVVIVSVRPYVVRIFAKKEMTMKDLGSMAVMMPKGLVPAILASLPLQMGMIGGQEI